MKVIGNITVLGTLGSGNGWQETGNSGINVDYYGIHTMERTFEVRNDVLYSQTGFFHTYFQGMQDGTFRQLYVVGIRVGKVTQAITEATVMYKGAVLHPNFTGDIKAARNVTKKKGVSTLQTTLHSQINFERKIQVSYRAPYSEWRYISVVEPNKQQPLFANQLIQANPFQDLEVLSFSGDIGNLLLYIDALIQPGQKAPIKNGEYIGYSTILPKKFDAEQVGTVWMVTEANELTLTDFATIYLNSFIQKGGNFGGGNGGVILLPK